MSLIAALWSYEDQQRALREGWGVFDGMFDGVFNGVEIQRYDEAELFENDDAAIEHVESEACNGSNFHARALMFVELSNLEARS